MTESVQYRLRPTQSTAMLSGTIRPAEKTYSNRGKWNKFRIDQFDLMSSDLTYGLSYLSPVSAILVGTPYFLLRCVSPIDSGCYTIKVYCHYA